MRQDVAEPVQSGFRLALGVSADCQDRTQVSAAAKLNNIPALLATSVVRGSQQGDSHGGVYLIEPARQAVTQVVDWNSDDIDWQGRGWDRGLRGIAFHDDLVYIAASDELFVYDQNFQLVRSHRNPYLKHCHEIAVFQDKLYLTSTGFDSILAFDLLEKRYCWGLYIFKSGSVWDARRFDPLSREGPPASNNLHLNNVTCDDHALCVSGLRTGGIVSLGKDVRLTKQVELPEGVHNATLLTNAVVFNDTRANFLRHITRDGVEKRFAYPTYDPAELEHADVDTSMLARQGFGRGLCLLSDRLIAVGSSPSTVSVFDLQTEQTVFSVNFSMDLRNAIHGLAVWPYSVPATPDQDS